MNFDGPSLGEYPRLFVFDLVVIGLAIAAFLTRQFLLSGAFFAIGMLSRALYDLIKTQQELAERQEELLEAVETVADDS